MDVQADMWCDIKQIKQILVGVVTLFDHKLDLLRTEIGTSTSTMNAGATDGDPVSERKTDDQRYTRGFAGRCF